MCVQIVRLLQGQDRRSTCRREERSRPIQLHRKQKHRPQHHTKKAYGFPRRHHSPELLLHHHFRCRLGRCGLVGVCGFIHIFLTVIIVICNGGEVRVMGIQSIFSIASALAFAFFAEPTGALIVETFESVFAFALGSSLALLEMNTWMLDDEGFGNSVKVAFVTD